MILKAEPGAVIEMATRDGVVPVADCLGNGRIMHITQQGYDQARGLGGVYTRNGLGDFDPDDVLGRKPTVSNIERWIEKEVRKHLPKRDRGWFQTHATWSKSSMDYSVAIWWCTEPTHEVVAEAKVTYETVVLGRDWRVALLRDLDEDLHRRKAS